MTRQTIGYKHTQAGHWGKGNTVIKGTIKKRTLAITIYGLLPVLLVLLTLFGVKANIVLPQVLGNNMVVQCRKPVAIWGSADAGQQIDVSFRGQHKTTRADLNGQWMVYLDPMSASDKPASMLISGKDNIELKNILTGEVWLCSGQSNMEYSMRKNSKVAKVSAVSGFDHSPVDELAYAHNAHIRIFLALRKPMAKPHPDHEGWSVAEDSALRAFSAPAYFFARKLYKSLHVPIGMISNAIPGSAIEPWLAGTIDGVDPGSHTLYFDYSNPGKFYPTLVQTLAPFSIRGFLWYQGETNCFMNDSIEYAYKMQALVSQWRTLWADSSLPFDYVQIAPFYYSKNPGIYNLDKNTLPKFWEAQTLCLQIPNTGMAVITDLPDDLTGIHPTGKWVVGERLAAIALHKTYGKRNEFSGPLYLKKALKGEKIWLYFEHIGDGLISRDHQPLSYFEVAGADAQYYPATVIIKGDHLEVYSKSVKRPLQARFAWDEGAQPNFFNKDGFPGVPFRTDNPYQHTVLR